MYSCLGNTRVLVVPFRGKKAVLAALRMFSVKRSTKEAFVEPFRVMNRKSWTSDNNYVLDLVHLGGKWFNSSNARQTGFTIPEKHPCLFDMGVFYPGFRPGWLAN